MKLLLADDHSLMREGIRSLLAKATDMDVVGEAENGQMAVQMARQLNPDVAILDITMPELNGIEATRQIKSHCPLCKVVVLSMHYGADLVAEALKAGANGYLTKNCIGQELVQAVHTVIAGQTYLSSRIASVVAEGYVDRLGESKDKGRDSHVLTSRQREVLQLLAEGYSTKQISQRLCRSIKTIEMHRHQIMQKLNFDSIADLTKYAIRKGLASLDSE